MDDYLSFLAKVYIDQFRSEVLRLVTRGKRDLSSADEETLASIASEADNNKTLVAEISLAALADPMKIYNNIKNTSRKDAELVHSFMMGEVYRFLPWEVWEYILDKFPYILSGGNGKEKHGRISSGLHREEGPMNKSAFNIPDAIKTAGWPSEINTSLLDPSKLMGIQFNSTEELDLFLDAIEQHAPEVSYEIASERTAVFPRIVERYVSDLAREIGNPFDLVQIKSAHDLPVHEREEFEASRKTRILGRFE